VSIKGKAHTETARGEHSEHACELPLLPLLLLLLLLLAIRTLHLDEEFRFDSPGRIILSIASVSTKGINFINENDGWRILARKFEQCLHQTLALALVLAHQIRRRHRQETTARFRRDGLRQERFT
jgi:hypothetical protein